MSSPTQTPSTPETSPGTFADDVATAYALPHPEVLRRLEVEPDRGLSAEAAAAGLERHGPNRLPEPDRGRK